MLTFVLIHGACHDVSAWGRVIERLNILGHRAFGPTVAGHGLGACRAVTHAGSTRSIVDFVVDNGLTDIVLVGHSYGGTIISKMAEAIPDPIRRLVFCDAFVLNDGESMLEAFPPGHREMLAALAAESDDNTVTLPFQLWRETFINDADLETARWAYDQLSPEPFQPLLEPLDMKKFYTLDIPKSYLVCTEVERERNGGPDGSYHGDGRHQWVGFSGVFGRFRGAAKEPPGVIAVLVARDWAARGYKLDFIRIPYASPRSDHCS
jgi:pimeloyl-ACP methyl ester carboxylesterase